MLDKERFQVTSAGFQTRLLRRSTSSNSNSWVTLRWDNQRSTLQCVYMSGARCQEFNLVESQSSSMLQAVLTRYIYIYPVVSIFSHQ